MIEHLEKGRLMESFVHFGFHKTGSTFIQETLRLNPKRFSRYHVVNQRNPRSSKALRTAIQEYFRGKTDLSGARVVLRDIIIKSDGKNILVSDEELAGFLPGRQREFGLYEKIRPVMDMMTEELPNVRFFTYTRPRDKWIQSVYQEALRRHHLKMDKKNFLNALKFKGDTADLARDLAKGYDFTHVDMSVDKERGLGHTLFLWAGLDSEEISALNLPKRTNESVTPSMEEAFLILNRTHSGADLMKLKMLLSKALVEARA
ncbi:hypothetical protein RGQ15_13520 [Paracoccus sp. MBLB3053]|uniref:Sulfotransferase family protein n=1 Tax=Paracoccus aurantius TaxID=3073814 RepID=A0ABU2HU63_9RHOB|nr:hypothetical protein [Paracoccus sp. MBLB3053]MDS9468583.1 hypothetical protein [Paracoccus sp. MBLB3053]